MLTRSEPDVRQPLRPNAEFVATSIPEYVRSEVVAPPPLSLANETVSKGFSQMFGLHIYSATLMLLVDSMVFAGDVVSLGTLLPLSIGAAGVLGFIVYKIQRRFYDDDHDAALVKALTCGLLTALPVPLAPLFTIPGGILGVVNIVRRKMK